MEFHEHILLGRNRARLTQRGLGLAIGANRASISLWEGGSRLPSLRKFSAMAEVFEWTDEEIAAAVRAAK